MGTGSSASVSAPDMAGASGAGMSYPPLSQPKPNRMVLARFVAVNLFFVTWLVSKQMSSSRALRSAADTGFCQSTNIVNVEAVHSEWMLDRVVILGERNSGTNALETVFRNNLQPGTLDVLPGITEIKHYFQRWPQYGDIETARTLTIMIVRNPYDWLQSMHRMCYCCEDLSIDAMPFDQFLNATFQLTLEDPVTHEKRPSEGCPVDINIHNLASPVFANVLEARYQKALHFLNISRWSAGFEVVHWEDIIDPHGQETLFKAIAAKWQLKTQPEFKSSTGDARTWNPTDNYNSTKRFLNSMYLNPAVVSSSEEARGVCKLINTKLNLFSENLMGYRILDC